MLKRAMAILLAMGLTLALGAGAFAAAPAITYANGYFSGLITTITYQYRTDQVNDITGAGWITISGITTLKADKGKVYWIKNQSDSYVETNYYKYSVLGDGTLPVLTGLWYDAAEGMLKGLSNDWQYNFTSATPAATAWRAITGNAIKIAKTDREQNIWFRTKATASAEASAAVLYVLEAGTASDLAANLKIDFVNEKFIPTGDAANWQYTTQSATYTGPYLYKMSDNDTCYPQSTYYVRGPGAAVGAKLVTPSRPAAPPAAAFQTDYNPGTGKIEIKVVGAGITFSNLRWMINTVGAWADSSTPGASNGADTIYVTPSSEQVLYVAYKAQGGDVPVTKNPDGSYSVSALAGRFASFNTSIRIWKSLGTGFEALRYDSVEGKIKGADNTMWYQVLPYDNGKAPDGPDASEPWIRPTGTNVTLNIERKDFDQTVYFCLNSVVGNPNGQTLAKDDYVELKLPYTVGETKAELYLEGDAEAVIITSDPADYRYSTNYSATSRTGTWKPLASLSSISANTPTSTPDNTYDLSGIIKGTDITLHITIWPKNPNEKPEPSAVWSEKIGEVAAPRLGSLTYEGTASNTSLRFTATAKDAANKDITNPDLQYKWAAVPNAQWEPLLPDPSDPKYYLLPAGYTAISYLIRVAPKDHRQGSVTVKGSTAAMPAAPKIKPDYKKGILTIKAGQSYWDHDLNGGLGDWTAPIARATQLSLPELYGSTVQVRTAGTAKKPASQVAHVDILQRHMEDGVEITPTQADITINAKGKLVMTPGTRQLEYLSAGKWKKGVPKLNTMDGLVDFRYAADSAHAPSESVLLAKPVSVTEMANFAVVGPLTPDLGRSVIYGLDPAVNNYVYRVKKKDTDKWKDIPLKYITYIEESGVIYKAFDLTTLLKGKAVVIELGVKDDPVTVVGSYEFKAGPAKQKVVIKEYIPSDTPGGVGTVRVDYVENLQYKRETDRAWTYASPTGILPGGFTAFSYQFRIKPQDDSTQGSPAVKAKVSAVPKAPAVKVDYKTGKIKLKAGWAYMAEGGTWSTAVGTAQTIDLDDLYGKTVYFRAEDVKNGNSKKPISLVTTVRMNPRFADELDSGVIMKIPSGATFKFMLKPGAHPVEFKSGNKWKVGMPAYGTSKSYEVRYAADSANGLGETKKLIIDAAGNVTMTT